MGKGRRYELDVLRELQAITDSDKVFASALDYSGNAAGSNADLGLLFVSPEGDLEHHLIEIKKRSAGSGTRFGTHPLEGSAEGENGRDELERLANAGTQYTKSWLLLSADYREPVLFNAEWLYEYLTGEPMYVSSSDTPPDYVIDAFEPRLTDGGNVSMRKPTTDEWRTASQGVSGAWTIATQMPRLGRWTEPQEEEATA